MPRGVVKWFSERKGFGFLVADGVVTDVFAHFSDIQMEGYRALKPDTIVDFELIHSDKGLLAKNIVPVDLSRVQPIGDPAAPSEPQTATT